MKVGGLALRLAVKSWARVALLAGLVAVSLVILLVVTELARLSSDGLDEAVAADVGREGTFSVGLSDISSLDQREVTDALLDVAASFGDPAPSLITSYGALRLDCPPLDTLGTHDVFFVRTAGGATWDFPYGTGLPDGSALCFDGLQVPERGVYLPPTGAQERWGSGLYLRPEYEPVVRSATVGPVRLTMSVVTGDPRAANALRAAAQRATAPLLSRAGITPADEPWVVRTDRAGELSAASRGVRAIYSAIGWGVVLLAGVGILITQLVITRSRMWLFGLARALGARPHEVVLLVLGESVLALAGGAVGAVALGIAAGPLVSSLSQEYFDVPARLWDPSNAAALGGALLVMLLVANVAPARRALAAEPLDTLEGRA